MNDKKRNLTLNLPPATNTLDQKNFDLRTPDILRIFNGGSSCLTPTSNAILKKTKSETNYSRSFEPAVVREYNLDSDQSDSNLPSDFPKKNNNGSISKDSSYPYSSGPLPLVDLIMTVESEDMNTTVSSAHSSPRFSPVDLQSQEEAKLELKRKRNREAASRCRKRKLENISKLEDAVKALKEENEELSQMLCNLKDEYDSLRQKFHKHKQNGCSLPGTM